MARRKLDETGGASARVHDGKVILTLWHEGRKPLDDPDAFEMTIGQALALIGELAQVARSAMLRTLGGRS